MWISAFSNNVLFQIWIASNFVIQMAVYFGILMEWAMKNLQKTLESNKDHFVETNSTETYEALYDLIVVSRRKLNLGIHIVAMNNTLQQCLNVSILSSAPTSVLSKWTQMDFIIYIILSLIHVCVCH